MPTRDGSERKGIQKHSLQFVITEPAILLGLKFVLFAFYLVFVVFETRSHTVAPGSLELREMFLPHSLSAEYWDCKPEP